MASAPDFRSQGPGFEFHLNSAHDCKVLHTWNFSVSPFHCLSMTNNVERDVKTHRPNHHLYLPICLNT